MNFEIRHEKINNYQVIKTVNDSPCGQPDKGLLIEEMCMNPRFIKELSLVAEIIAKVGGHTLFFSVIIQ